ncbi:MAG: 50S ribosomal protein L23 [Acidimicrobiaceae bacterium]|nr:50S ribosomal protein L23 [Acidimicrobiaceae bacterium]
MDNPRSVILKPVVSEKSYRSMDENFYTFVVAPRANKVEIRKAVEQIFGVKVLNVNTLNRKGKRKKNRKSGEFSSKPDTKRAIVKLAENDRIDLFDK